MWPTATDGATDLSVCLSVTFMSPAKRAELIKMPFGRLACTKGTMYWSRSLNRKKQFWEPLLSCIYSERDHVILSNGKASDVAYHQHSLTTCYEKNSLEKVD